MLIWKQSPRDKKGQLHPMAFFEYMDRTVPSRSERKLVEYMFAPTKAPIGANHFRISFQHPK